MTKLAVGRDGFVTSYSEALEAKTWEGGDQTDQKPYVARKRVLLRPEEKRSLDRFMASPTVQNYTSSENRRVIIENEAAMELLAVRQKSAELIAQGKDPLPESEYRLHLSKDGVVISENRLKEERKNSLEAQRTSIETANEVFEL
jgi:hypothetical protein